MCYAIAGYATAYEYYAYPDNTRPRISQMLVLPPFQRIGLGAELLDSIYRHYISQPRVVDITGLFYTLLIAVEHMMLLCNCRLRIHKFLFWRAGCHVWATLGTFSLCGMYHQSNQNSEACSTSHLKKNISNKLEFVLTLLLSNALVM
jgi:GNAT superfamily N-acetyltransferase